MTETELNLPGIIIKKDALAGDVTYRLKVNVNQAHGPAGISSYQFRTNAPPDGGQCTVKPLNGSALKTLFNIQCSGWKVRFHSLIFVLRATVFRFRYIRATILDKIT